MTKNNSFQNIPVEEVDSFDLNGILAKYFNYWYYFVISIVAFLIIGLIYIIFQTPLYEIKGKLLIKDNVKEANNNQINNLNGFDLFSSDKVLDNEVELLKSTNFLETTIRDLNLQVNVLCQKGLIKKDLYASAPLTVNVIMTKPKAFAGYIDLQPLSTTKFKIDGQTYLFNNIIYTEYGSFVIRPGKALDDYIGKSLYLKINDIDDLVDYYNNSLSVEQTSSQSTVLLFTLTDAVPQRGKDFINKLIEVYNIKSINDKNEVTSASLKFIEGRLDSISTELNGVEKNVEKYKSSNNITDISSQSRIYLENQQQNDNTLNKVLIQLNVLQNLENYLRSKQDAGLPSTLGLDDPTLNGLVRQLTEVLNNKESLLQTIPENNPIIQSLNDQIASLKKSVYAGVENIKSGLQITRDRLQAKGNQFESVIQRVPSKERGLIDVMRQQDIKNNLFIYLLEKREETSLALASNISNSHVVDSPRSSKYPVSPKKSIIYLVFFFLGLIFPTVIFFIRDVLNYKIKSRFDIEKITRIPVVAEIAHAKNRANLAPVEAPRSIVAEQVRALRTNLSLTAGFNPRVILFTSSVSGEGKSFIAVNLGCSLACINKRVVIIDLDLRKPKLNLNLNVKMSPGLSDYLHGDLDYSSIIQPIREQKGYHVITCGTIPKDPAELLHNKQLDKLIDLLKNEFDYIILDAPPVGLVTDAQILEKFADTTLFIVRYKFSSKSHVRAINRLFVEKKFKNMRIVFNSVGIEGQEYGYNNGYGYYEQPAEKPWFKTLFVKN